MPLPAGNFVLLALTTCAPASNLIMSLLESHVPLLLILACLGLSDIISMARDIYAGCCTCLSACKPRWKRLVDNIFPAVPEVSVDQVYQR